jgi:hypothetical protein
LSFVVLALPRSRTKWLSKFLTYGDWSCSHEELRHLRSLDDAKTWLAQDCTGTAETSAAPWWRLLKTLAPETKLLLVRRPLNAVVDSLMALPGVSFDREKLETALRHHDRKLDQIEARVECLSVNYADLDTLETCKAVFEYCLPYAFDEAHWRRWAGENVQCDMRGLMRYMAAFGPVLEKLAKVAKHHSIKNLCVREPVVSDGMTIQTESFDDWVRDGAKLFDDHLVLVGEAPGEWEGKNLPLMKSIYDAGFMQIVTARSNGRMFGYLMTVIAPSLTSAGKTTAASTTFYASPDAPGLGLKLQRANAKILKERGVDHVMLQAGSRGSGPRLATMFKRLGAQDDGQMFRLQLEDC